MDITLALDLPQVLNLLLAVVFPVLVGLVTTKVTRSWVKAVLLATIALLSGLVSAMLAAVLAGASFDLVGALLTGLAAWIIAVATHLGFWKPTGVTEAVQSIGSPTVPDETPSTVTQVNHFVAYDPGRAEEAAKVATEVIGRSLRGD